MVRGTSRVAAVRLTELRRRTKHRVTRLEEARAALIASFGIYPGVVVEVRQRRPSFVVRCEHSEIAMDESLAADIWVELEEVGG